MAAVDDAFAALRQAMANLHAAKNLNDNARAQAAVAADQLASRQAAVDAAWDALNALM